MMYLGGLENWEKYLKQMYADDRVFVGKDFKKDNRNRKGTKISIASKKKKARKKRKMENK